MKFNSGVWKTSVFAPLKHGSSEGSFSETCEFPGNGVFVHLSVGRRESWLFAEDESDGFDFLVNDASDVSRDVRVVGRAGHVHRHAGGIP